MLCILESFAVYGSLQTHARMPFTLFAARYTNACSADSDSEVCLAVSDSTADFLTVYRIVTALCGVGSEV